MSGLHVETSHLTGEGVGEGGRISGNSRVFIDLFEVEFSFQIELP